jgi:hypothetical protein
MHCKRIPIDTLIIVGEYPPMPTSEEKNGQNLYTTVYGGAGTVAVIIDKCHALPHRM